YLADLHELDFPRTLDDKLLEPSRRVRTMDNPLLRPAQRLLKSGVIEWLQHIIERTGFKGTQRVLIVCGHEDHGWRQLVAQHLKHVKAVAFRHLHVQKHQIRAATPYLTDRLLAQATAPHPSVKQDMKGIERLHEQDKEATLSDNADQLAKLWNKNAVRFHMTRPTK